MESRASRRVVPLAFPSFLSTAHPLYQDMFLEVSNMLSPCHPEIGTNGTEAGFPLLPLNSPSLVPGHVLGSLQHVVSMPSRDWHEWNRSWVVANLLDEARHFLLDFLKPGLAVRRLSGVHLVNSDNELLDPQGV